jgi:hypothetical protein
MQKRYYYNRFGGKIKLFSGFYSFRYRIYTDWVVHQYFRVVNPNNRKINISNLSLARGNSSFYRLNIDGIPGKSFQNIEIAAGDSIYVFVEVTIDPNAQSNPFVYQDSVVFETNGNIQDVDLYSVARNCYLHLPTNVVYLSNGGTSVMALCHAEKFGIMINHT